MIDPKEKKLFEQYTSEFQEYNRYQDIYQLGTLGQSL